MYKAIFHWIQALVISLKIITGFYLFNQVYFSLPVIWVKIHFYLTYLLLINFILWGYSNLLTGYHRILIMKIQKLKQVPGFIKQRLLMTFQDPFYGAENPRQKFIFFLGVFLFMVEFVTGFSLYFQDISQGFLSLAGGAQRVSAYHFLGALGILSIVTLQIYLHLRNDSTKLQA